MKNIKIFVNGNYVNTVSNSGVGTTCGTTKFGLKEECKMNNPPEQSSGVSI